MDQVLFTTKRMGTTDFTKKCETCKEDAQQCHGHFGYISLEQPVIHPLHYKRVVAFLNCFCHKCSRLLVSQDQLCVAGLDYRQHSGSLSELFKCIHKRLTKVNFCCHEGCGTSSVRWKFSAADGEILKVYEARNQVRTSISISPEEIRKILDAISNEDVELLGLDPELVHPRNFVITILPVLPPCARPYVNADGNMCDDDLTNQYIEIVKTNNYLKGQFFSRQRSA